MGNGQHFSQYGLIISSDFSQSKQSVILNHCSLFRLTIESFKAALARKVENGLHEAPGWWNCLKPACVTRTISLPFSLN